MFSLPFPTVIHNIDGATIFLSETVNMVPVFFFFILEPNWKVFAFPDEYSTGINHFNENRNNPITPSKYVHAGLKCCDDRFAFNSQYIFHALD